ncbi:MAG: thiamine phosphate synthase [Euryarchaeota archaeon]|nr:thiamine phosphate synthase [Euryarchaeota archaeon]
MPRRSRTGRDWGLYVVTDEGLSRGLSHTQIAHQALAGGADVIQLRDKGLDGRALLGQALAIRDLTRRAGKLFIVNDRLDVALASGADGVHLGQEDLPLAAARPIAPRGFLIGVTVHDVWEAREAERGGADYLGLSPIFATGSKSDAGKARGLGTLRKVRRAVSVPVVAIGGISLANAREVLEAGADGLAVISAVVSQPDVEEAARRLKAIVTAFRRDFG